MEAHPWSVNFVSFVFFSCHKWPVYQWAAVWDNSRQTGQGSFCSRCLFTESDDLDWWFLQAKWIHRYGLQVDALKIYPTVYWPFRRRNVMLEEQRLKCQLSSLYFLLLMHSELCKYVCLFVFFRAGIPSHLYLSMPGVSFFLLGIPSGNGISEGERGPSIRRDLAQHTVAWGFLGFSTLTLSLPRVINFKLLLQPHQKYNITQYEELGFSY